MKLERNASGEAFSGERFIFSDVESDLELEHVHRYILASKLCNGKSVLDAACGDGFGTVILASEAESVVGIDVDRGVIEHARKSYVRDNIQFSVQSVTAIEFESASFDVIISFETIEHVAEQDKVMAEFARLLKPNGVLLISSPDRQNYNRDRVNPNPFHVKELSKQEFTAIIGKYFTSNVFYSQFNVLGSAIVGSGRAIEDVEIIRRSPDDNEIVHELLDHKVMYHVAVCGNGDLPVLTSGFYQGGIPQNTMSSLLGGIGERDEAIRKCTSRISALEQERAAFADGCEERDGVIAGLRHDLAEANREKGAFAGGCEERDAVIVGLRLQVATLSRPPSPDDEARQSALVSALREQIAAQDEEMARLIGAKVRADRPA